MEVTTETRIKDLERALDARHLVWTADQETVARQQAVIDSLYAACHEVYRTFSERDIDVPWEARLRAITRAALDKARGA